MLARLPKSRARAALRSRRARGAAPAPRDDAPALVALLVARIGEGGPLTTSLVARCGEWIGLVDGPCGGTGEALCRVRLARRDEWRPAHFRWAQAEARVFCGSVVLDGDARALPPDALAAARALAPAARAHAFAQSIDEDCAAAALVGCCVEVEAPLVGPGNFAAIARALDRAVASAA